MPEVVGRQDLFSLRPGIRHSALRILQTAGRSLHCVENRPGPSRKSESESSSFGRFFNFAPGGFVGTFLGGKNQGLNPLNLLCQCPLKLLVCGGFPIGLYR